MEVTTMKQTKSQQPQFCDFSRDKAFRAFVKNAESKGLLINPYTPAWLAANEDSDLLCDAAIDFLTSGDVEPNFHGHLLVAVNRDGCDELLGKALPAVEDGLLCPRFIKSVLIFINLATGQILACGAGEKGRVFLNDAFTHKPVELDDDYMNGFTCMDHADIVGQLHNVIAEFSDGCHNFFLANSSFCAVDTMLSETFSGYPKDAYS